MAPIDSSGFARVRLTVTDIARSRAVDDRVLGWEVAVDESAAIDEPGVRDSSERFHGGVIHETPQGTRPRPVGSTGFDAGTTGLDHLAVAARADLHAAADALTGAGIEHGEVTELTAPLE